MTILSIIGWVLSVAVTFFLGKSAVEKVIGTKESVGNFAFFKMDDYRVVVGLGELLGIVLLLIPQTSIYGAILISCFMSAAVALHLSLMGGLKVNVPILVGIGAFAGFALRLL